MFNRPEEKDWSEKQKQILAFLLEKPYLQKDLTAAMQITGAGLLYHLNILEAESLITKKTVIKVGAVSLKEVALHPNAQQRVRNILQRQKTQYTLITGFGRDSVLGESSMIPSIGNRLLQREGYKISKIIAFVTPESNTKQAQLLETKITLITHPYLDYRNEFSDIFQNLESIIQAAQKNEEIIIDITPLTKLSP